MEQHAVPQDITGFKFKLVGEMTLLQFGELAAGLVVGYLFYASPLPAVIKWPLAILSGLFGAALAFLPIEERPLHTWIFNFFKAIYRPTYFTWKKDSSPTNLASPPQVLPVNSTPSSKTSSIAEAQVALPPSKSDEETLPSSPRATIPIPSSTPKPSEQPLSSFPSSPDNSDDSEAKSEASPATPQGPAPVPIYSRGDVTSSPAPTASSSESSTRVRSLSIQELMEMRQEKQRETNTPVKTTITVDDLVKMRSQASSDREDKNYDNLQKSEDKFNQLIEKNKQFLLQIDQIKEQIYRLSGKDTSSLERKLESLLLEKNQLMAEINLLREQITRERVAPVSNASYKEPVIRAPSKTKPTPPPPQEPIVISLTSIPNVINGVVFDTQDKPLDGVIIIIKDSSGNSIRALKTSKLGQFIVSTPLPVGTYYLELEKPGHEFNIVEVPLSGQVLQPIQIRSKSPLSSPTSGAETEENTLTVDQT